MPTRRRSHADTIPAAPPQPSGRSGGARAAFAPPVFATGELVADNYEIRALLGVGGMGQVYEAHDRQLNRRVAVKVAPASGDRDALRREGQALAAIRHPSVVAVYTMGMHRGTDFLVMERVYGMTLDTIIDQRRRRGERVELREGLDLLVAIADGLASVHRAGLAHRDVKPANVMLAPGGRVVLMDFGLMLPAIEGAVDPTRSGTFEYMAPEALRDDVAPGGAHLLDLYALGVTAFQLLTGILPERDVSLARARPDAPAALVDLVCALMSPDPQERPASAEAVVWQLRGIRDRRASAPPRPLDADAAAAVLIAHGDPKLRDLFELYVGAALPDAPLESVTTGKAALAQLRRRMPRLFLLGTVLPDMNAVEVCMYLRGLPRGELCTIAVAVKPGENATFADVQLLRQLGVRLFEKEGALVSDLAALLEEIKAGSHTY